MQSHIHNFVAYLDVFKNTGELNREDILKIINVSNLYYMTYIDNHSKLLALTNDLNPPPPDYDTWLTTHDITQQFVALEQKVENEPCISFFTETEKEKEKEERLTTNSPVIKEKVFITDKIINVSDLINIINKYPLDETKEYNIDLQKLNQIKPELEELNNMIGMDELKSSIIDQLFYFLQDLHLSNLGGDFKHTVIYGPPGTGKTEIAKIIGRMFSKIGILKKNIFKKVVRSDLVAGYLGQTAIKTRKIIDECLGGVLFIDEAYSLSLNKELDSYSQECIDTLCEALSDHKDNLMVIVAGYEDEMKNSFFKSNKGLESRFIWRFKIDNYTSKQLFEIFRKKVDDSGWTLMTESSEKWFESKKHHFIYFGRDIEILFLYTKIAHARRVYGQSIDCRKQILLEDIEKGFDTFVKNKGDKVEDFKDRYPHMWV